MTKIREKFKDWMQKIYTLIQLHIIQLADIKMKFLIIMDLQSDQEMLFMYLKQG
jgi:hypothetical protein